MGVRWKRDVLVICGVSLLGACSGPTLSKKPRTQAEIMECERRITAISQSSEQLRASSPREMVEPKVADPQPVRWGKGNNPCRPEGFDPLSAEAMSAEGESRQLAKVRTRNFIAQGQAVEAFDALSGAFQLGTPEDPELRALSVELEPAYTSHLETLSQAAMQDDTKAHCHFAKEDFATMRTQLRVRFFGESPVYIQCGLPTIKGLDKPSAQVWLVVRRRVTAGHYELVQKRHLGSLEEALSSPVLNSAWTPVIADIKDPKAYFTASLVLIDDRGNQSTTERQGFFWFSEPDAEPMPAAEEEVVAPEAPAP